MCHLGHENQSQCQSSLECIEFGRFGKNLSDTRSTAPTLAKYCHLPSKFCLTVCFLAKKREAGIILNYHNFGGGYL